MSGGVNQRLHIAWSYVSRAVDELRFGTPDFRSHPLGYVNTQAEAIANDLRKVQEDIDKLRDAVRVHDNRPFDR